jgi:hypothetical protein
MKLIRSMCAFALATMLAASVSLAANNATANTTSQFKGSKANTGTATFYKEGGKNMLKVSDDFKVPDTPAPTWRVVDSKGQVYTLDAFKVKEGLGSGEKRQVVTPAYVHDIAKVEVYCAWAQVLLGEAKFAAPVK